MAMPTAIVRTIARLISRNVVDPIEMASPAQERLHHCIRDLIEFLQIARITEH
jgi:hypothetical protein